MESEISNLLSCFEFKEIKSNTWKYQLENLIITIYPSVVTIQGSLSKFYFGYDLFSLNRKTTQLAIERLSENLQLDIQNALVTRIDIAANLEMSHKVECYFPFLGDYSRRYRTRYKSSLYYNSMGENNPHSCLFYDKGKQLHKGTSFLLRFESRWERHLSKQLTWDNIKGKTLYDPCFYQHIILLWQKDYFAIKKRNIPMLDQSVSIETYKEAKDYMTNYGIHSIPVIDKMKIIEFLKANLTKPGDRVKFNKWLDKMNNDENMNSTSVLIEELDYKIRSRVLEEIGILL